MLNEKRGMSIVFLPPQTHAGSTFSHTLFLSPVSHVNCRLDLGSKAASVWQLVNFAIPHGNVMEHSAVYRLINGDILLHSPLLDRLCSQGFSASCNVGYFVKNQKKSNIYFCAAIITLQPRNACWLLFWGGGETIGFCSEEPPWQTNGEAVGDLGLRSSIICLLSCSHEPKIRLELEAKVNETC